MKKSIVVIIGVLCFLLTFFITHPQPSVRQDGLLIVTSNRCIACRSIHAQLIDAIEQSDCNIEIVEKYDTAFFPEHINPQYTQLMKTYEIPATPTLIWLDNGTLKQSLYLATTDKNEDTVLDTQAFHQLIKDYKKENK